MDGGVPRSGTADPDLGPPPFPVSSGRPLLPGRTVLTPLLETTTSSRQAAPVAIASSSVRGLFVVVGRTTRGP